MVKCLTEIAQLVLTVNVFHFCHFIICGVANGNEQIGADKELQIFRIRGIKHFALDKCML